MRTTGTSPIVARRDIDELIALYDPQRPTFFSDFITKSKSTTKKDFRYQSYGELGTAPIVNEANPIPDDDIFVGFPRTVIPYKRGLGFSAATEVFETDQWDIFENIIPQLRDSQDRTLEYIAALIHNNATATGTAYLMGDGKALAATDHVLDAGATDSNLITDAFGYLAMEKAFNNMLQQKGHRGDPQPVMPPVDLLIHPANAMYAERLCGAVGMPGSNNNDQSTVRRRIRKVVANPYFTNTLSWAFKATGARDPFEWLWRRRPTSKQQEDIDNDVMKFRNTMIVAAFARFWRGYYYSKGDGS